jgi:hypothetical protein
MRTGLLCLLLCLACGACATSAERCEGPLQPINRAQAKGQSNAAPASPDPGPSVP